MLIASPKMTAAEFTALPEDAARTRYELVQGEVIVSPSPSFPHARVVTELSILLGSHIEKHALGMLFSDIDTYFGPEDVRRPDLFFFRSDRLYLLESLCPKEPPDLCVEVLSPSNWRTDTEDKFQLYEAAGVGNYWIVDPMEKSVLGYSLRDGRYVNSGHGAGSDHVCLPPFDDFQIPLAKLWWPLHLPSRP